MTGQKPLSEYTLGELIEQMISTSVEYAVESAALRNGPSCGDIFAARMAAVTDRDLRQAYQNRFAPLKTELTRREELYKQASTK